MYYAFFRMIVRIIKYLLLCFHFCLVYIFFVTSTINYWCISRFLVIQMIKGLSFKLFVKILLQNLRGSFFLLPIFPLIIFFLLYWIKGNMIICLSDLIFVKLILENFLSVYRQITLKNHLIWGVREKIYLLVIYFI